MYCTALECNKQYHLRDCVQWPASLYRLSARGSCSWWPCCHQLCAAGSGCCWLSCNLCQNTTHSELNSLTWRNHRVAQMEVYPAAAAAAAGCCCASASHTRRSEAFAAPAPNSSLAVETGSGPRLTGDFAVAMGPGTIGRWATALLGTMHREPCQGCLLSL